MKHIRWAASTVIALPRRIPDPIAAAFRFDPEEYEPLDCTAAGKSQGTRQEAAVAMALGLDKDWVKSMLNQARVRPR